MLRITRQAPSVKLSRDDIERLGRICITAKTASYDSFVLKGLGHEVSSADISELMQTNWPQHIEKLEFRVSSGNVWLRLHAGLASENELIVSGEDEEWVTTTEARLLHFLRSHKTWNWIAYNYWFGIAVSMLLGLIVAAAAPLVTQDPKDAASWGGPAIPLSFAILQLFSLLLAPFLLPYLQVEGHVPAAAAKLVRGALWTLLSVGLSVLSGFIVARFF